MESLKMTKSKLNFYETRTSKVDQEKILNLRDVNEDKIDNNFEKLIRDLTINQSTVKKLIEKCRINSSDNDLPCDQLKQLIENVCVTDELILMAETVAAYENVIFDFDCDLEVVYSLDYLYGLPGFGDDLIYIPINCKTELEKVKKLAVELTRCAMQIVYENNFLPYPEDFEVIVSPEKWSQDLNHYYSSFYEKIQPLDKISQSVMKKIMNLKNNLEIFDGNEIRELNRKFCLLQKMKNFELESKKSLKLKSYLKRTKSENIYIKSNVPCLVLHNYFNELKISSSSNATNLFVDLSAIHFDNIRKNFSTIAKSESIDNIFVDATDCNEESVKILMSAERTASLIVVGNDEKLFPDFKIETFNFTWKDFCEETKEILLQKTIKYQHRQVQFGEVFKSNLDDLPPEVFQNLCSDHQFVFNSTEFVISDSITRTFKINDPYGAFLNSSKLYAPDFTTEELVKKVDNNKIILLADRSKSGKTTALRKIFDELSKGKTFVAFLSLEKLKEIKEKSYDEFVCNFLKNNNRGTEENQFKENYTKNGVIIILDGINDINTEDLCQFLKSFDKTKGKNQLWIGTSEKIGHKILNFSNVVRIKLKPYSEQEILKSLGMEHTNSLKNACENYVKNNLNFYAKSIYHCCALNMFLDKNEKKIFGATLFPYKTNYVDFLNDNILRKETEIFRKFFLLLPYLVADFVNETLKVDLLYQIEEFSDFFLSLLIQADHKNVRKMLSDMKISDIKVHEDCNFLFRDALLRHFKRDKTIKFHFEEQSIDLSIFTISLISKITWDFSNVFSIGTISEVLSSLAPYFKYHQQSTSQDCLLFLKKYPSDIIEHIMKTKTNYGCRVFERISQSFENTQLVSFLKMFDMTNLINDMEVENCIFKICINKKNEGHFKIFMSLISFEKWKNVMKITFEDENLRFFDLIKEASNQNKNWLNVKSVNETKTRYENIKKEIKKLHEDIKKENIRGIQEFIQRNPNLKICIVNNRSALELACEEEKYNSFETLYENNFGMNPSSTKFIEFNNRFFFKLKLDSVKSESFYKNQFLIKCQKSAVNQVLRI
jgi:hypothetical protein